MSNVPDELSSGLAQQRTAGRQLDLEHLQKCLVQSGEIRNGIAEHMAHMLGSSSATATAQQEAVAPETQHLSKAELELKIEAAAREASEADANLARFLADHVPHNPMGAVGALPAGSGGHSAWRTALIGDQQQRPHNANIALAGGLDALQQAALAAHMIDLQHPDTAPPHKQGPKSRSFWPPRPITRKWHRIIAALGCSGGHAGGDCRSSRRDAAVKRHSWEN